MIYFFLFMLAAFLLGFPAGIAVKSFLDKDEIIDLEKQNARLHKELTNMRRKKVDTIEIVDPTVGASVDFSKNW